MFPELSRPRKDSKHQKRTATIPKPTFRSASSAISTDQRDVFSRRPWLRASAEAGETAQTHTHTDRERVCVWFFFFQGLLRALQRVFSSPTRPMMDARGAVGWQPVHRRPLPQRASMQGAGRCRQGALRRFRAHFQGLANAAAKQSRPPNPSSGLQSQERLAADRIRLGRSPFREFRHARPRPNHTAL